MLPTIRNDLAIYPGPDTRSGLPTWTLHDPVRNQFFNLGQLHVELLRRWGLNNPETIQERINQETALTCQNDDIDDLIQFLSDQQLLHLESSEDVEKLLQRKQAAKQTIGHWLLHHYLFFRIPLFRPNAFLQNTLVWVKPLFSKTAAAALVFILFLGLFLVSRQWDNFISTFDYFFSIEGALIFSFALIISKIVHELGHAYTCKYYGLKVPTMGIAFLLMWPVAYTDTTDAWRLTSRRKRMAIGAAGMIAELSLAGIATLAWNFLPDGPLRSAAFFIAAVSWIMTLAINSNPFMKWDGYYLFSDWLGIDNLQQRAFALAKWKLRRVIFGFDLPPPEAFNTKMQRTLLIYAYSTWVYRTILFLGIAFIVYELFFKLAGIFLLVVELLWFIGKPIFQELQIWFKLRPMMTLNWPTVRSSFLLLFTIFVFVYPWNSRIHLAAVYEPIQSTQIYAPFDAQLKKIHVKEKQLVTKGDTLFSLQSPDLNFLYEQNKWRSDSLENQLKRHSSNAELLEYNHVLSRRLAKTRAAQSGNQEALERLNITAPFSGYISAVADSLLPNRWINKSLVLARLNSSEMHITAYLDETALQRITLGSQGFFYPTDASLKPITVTVIQIDQSPVSILNEPYSASIYGGNVAVSFDRNQQLVLHQAQYRIHLRVDGESVSRERILRGEVQLQGDALSIVMRLWRSVSAILIRESGF